MKKFFLALTGAAMLAGSAMAVPQTAEAAGWHHNRPHQVCRVVVKKRVVWRNHRRHVERYRVRQCNWVRR
ncbi:MAG TPA: hypothetical protein VGM46_10040 [Mesorhizobium sp.]|jgi:hypothetical protein